ncbi:hypothetical protein BGZ81_003534, partial [Podila clonocystis]
MSHFVQKSVEFSRPVIVVVPNYRLGVLGFLSSQELKDDYVHRHCKDPDLDESFGNWGLLDQKMAFEWIQNHIQDFGGSTTNVTAMGYSSGGACIWYHSMIKHHHGLFTKAILHGAGSLTSADATACLNQGFFDRLCQNFGIKGCGNEPSIETPSRVQQMREIPAEQLLYHQEIYGKHPATPSLENTFLFPKHVFEMMKDPTCYDPGLQSVISGSCLDEGTCMAPYLGATKREAWQPFLDELFSPELQPEVCELYGEPQTHKDVRQLSSLLLRDFLYWYPLRVTRQALLASPSTSRSLPTSNCASDSEREMIPLSRPRIVNQYFLETRLTAIEEMGGGLGALHASENAFILLSDACREFMTEMEIKFGYQIAEKWVNFIWDQ